MKLVTPLGEIDILIDGREIEYDFQTVDVDSSCKDVEGRYAIQVSFVPDGREHIISCKIRDYKPSEMDDIESGENLELKSFYNGGAKLSIGMEGDSGYINGERISTIYDYDNEYQDDGVDYVILGVTKTQIFTFGIAWIDNCTENNEVQTWFGADPTIMKL